MRKNDSWLSPTSSSSYSYGGAHYRSSSFSIARFFRVILFLAVIVVVLSVLQLLRGVPLPKAQATVSDALIPGSPPSLPWPSVGGAEVALQNVGIIGSYNANSPMQLASVAKIITALVVIKDHPLSLGSTGPSVSITASDVATYQSMFAQQDSVMAVAQGESLDEYQMLEALLIPSADNIALKLAIWDAGSVPAFVAKMNSMAKSLGMLQTHYEDPSGLNSKTVGSAHDQLIAGLNLLKSPVLAQIVSKPQATLPVAGVVFNVNSNVTHDGFVGVKTGSMGNGGDLVFAATGVSGSSNLIVGSVLDQQGYKPLRAALVESRQLVDAARKIPTRVTALSQGKTVAMISAPGTSPVAVVATKAVDLVGWPGLKVIYSISFDKLGRTIAAGTKVGTLRVSIGSQSQSVALVTTKAIQAPSVAWRLKRL